MKDNGVIYNDYLKYETVTFRGEEVIVGFEYQPYEPMVMYYKDGSGHPGCPSDAIICEIWDYNEEKGIYEEIYNLGEITQKEEEELSIDVLQSYESNLDRDY